MEKEINERSDTISLALLHLANAPKKYTLLTPKSRFIITWRFFSLESSFRFRVERRKERSWMVAARGVWLEGTEAKELEE